MAIRVLSLDQFPALRRELKKQELYDELQNAIRSLNVKQFIEVITKDISLTTLEGWLKRMKANHVDFVKRKNNGNEGIYAVANKNTISAVKVT